MRKYKIDYDGLKDYLETLTPGDIKNSLGFWLEKEYSHKVGTPILVDLLGGDISILWRTKRKFRLSTGRLVRGKFDCTLIDSTREQYGIVLNGCWTIPEQFLIRE